MTLTPATNPLDVEGMPDALTKLLARIDQHPEYNQERFRDEDILKRILVARDFNLDLAYKQWEALAHWRTTFKPETITKERVQRELDTRKSEIAGRDKFGRPCIVVRPTHHIPNPQSVEDVINLTVYMLETSTALSRQHGDGYLCVIWEHTGTGYKNMDTAALLGKQGFITLLKEYYPERLASLYFINLNWLFRIFLKMVMPLLDDRMKKKLILLDSEANLLQYFEPEGLPTEYRERLCPASTDMTEE